MITARDLAARKGDFVLVDIREADEVAEDGKELLEEKIK